MYNGMSEVSQILSMNGSAKTELRKINIDLMSDISILRKQKAILTEITKIMYEVMKMFGDRATRDAMIKRDLMDAMNELVTKMMPEDDTETEYKIKMKEIDTRKTTITQSMLKGISDIEYLRHMIDESDEFLFK